MSFIFRRKRFKFLVTFEVEELSLTPFVNGVLFAKIRLTSNGSFEDFTTREEVCNHRVQWKKKCQFESRINANNSTFELENCICRVSVRKEAKGGKAYQKLGFADVNLSEFAGAGHASRRYLLEGYSTKTRLDNSLLLVNICMKLLSGDPVFKVPKAKSVGFHGEISQDPDLQPENKGAVSGSEDSVASGSSGFGSLTRSKKEENAALAEKLRTSADLKATSSSVSGVSTNEEKDSFDTNQEGSQATPSAPTQGQGQQIQGHGHVRNNSSTSAASKVSGYHSLGGIAVAHSRQGSSDSSNTPLNTHKRSRSVDVGDAGKINPLAARKNIEPASSIEQRLGSTRVDADEVIENLLKSTDFKGGDTGDRPGLELYVAQDGSTAFSTQQLQDKRGYERVIMDAR